MAVLLVVVLVAATGVAPTGAQVLEPAAPSITVDPDVLLVDGQSVTVSGSGFEANSQIGVLQCRTGGGFGECTTANVRFVQTDNAGDFLTLFPVRRLLNVGGTSTDCADEGACVIAAGLYSGDLSTTSAPIRFDPDVPPPPPPTVTATPDTDLVDGQTITLAGSGFTPGTVAAVQCATAVPGAPGCTTGRPVFGEADEEGEATIELRVRRFLTIQGTTYDCAEPGTCTAAIGEISTMTGASAAITFDPEAPLLPPPTVTVQPTTGLVDGQDVTITGSGYEPNVGVTIVQCRTVGGDTSGRGCHMPSLRGVSTDDEGAFTTTFRVLDRLTTQSGEVDCAVAAGTCMIAVVWQPDITTAVVTEVSFAAEPAPTTTTPAARPARGARVTPRFAG